MREGGTVGEREGQREGGWTPPVASLGLVSPSAVTINGVSISSTQKTDDLLKVIVLQITVTTRRGHRFSSTLINSSAKNS